MTAMRRWQDYLTMLLGVVLFVTPFAFGDTSHTTAAYTAYVLGILLFLSGLLAAALQEARNVEIIPVNGKTPNASANMINRARPVSEWSG